MLGTANGGALKLLCVWLEYGLLEKEWIGPRSGTVPNLFSNQMTNFWTKDTAMFLLLNWRWSTTVAAVFRERLQKLYETTKFGWYWCLRVYGWTSKQVVIQDNGERLFQFDSTYCMFHAVFLFIWNVERNKPWFAKIGTEPPRVDEQVVNRSNNPGTELYCLKFVERIEKQNVVSMLRNF